MKSAEVMCVIMSSSLHFVRQEEQKGETVLVRRIHKQDIAFYRFTGERGVQEFLMSFKLFIVYVGLWRHFGKTLVFRITTKWPINTFHTQNKFSTCILI